MTGTDFTPDMTNIRSAEACRTCWRPVGECCCGADRYLTPEAIAEAIDRLRDAFAAETPVSCEMVASLMIVDPWNAEFFLADHRKARRMWRKKMSNRDLLVEVVLQEDVRNYRAGTTLWAKLRLGRKARPGTYWEAVDPADGSTFRLSRSQAKKACPGQPGTKEVR